MTGVAVRFRDAIAAAAATVAAVVAVPAAQPGDRAIVGERFLTLTRESRWTEVSRTPMAFPTFHPQGMVRIGDALFVTSVEVTTPTVRYPTPRDGLDRSPGAGVGHVFKVDLRPGHAGALLASVTLGDGAIYHPGGLDFDGTSLWIPVAEYRPDSRSIVYTVNPETLKATVVLQVGDHIGGLVRDRQSGALHGVSWGSRRFYRWTLRADGTVDDAAAAPTVRTNPSHYVDYQDCQYAGPHAMLCGGVSDLRGPSGAPPIRLGGLVLVDLDDGRPLHQIPVALWTASGQAMTRNPVWLEPGAGNAGLRVWFMPEDDASVLYVFDAR